MLSEKAFKDNIQVLYASFKHKGNMSVPDKVTLQIWFQALQDMTDDQLNTATAFIVRNDEWFPTMARIRKVAGFSLETEKGSVSLAESQWEIFRTAFGHIGYRAMSEKWLDGGQVFEDGITDAVAKTIAKDYAMSHIDEAGNWRSRFIKAYDNMKEFGKKTNEFMKIGNLISLSQHKQSELDTKTALQACKK